MNFDKETWEFINTFAPWLSALGTIAAVIVALYLSNREKRIRLRVSAGHRMLIIPGQNIQEENEFLVINIVNIGYRSAIITNIGWKVGFIKKQLGIQMTINDGYSKRIPTKLNEGEEANYYIPLNTETNWINNFLNNFLQPHPRLRLKFTKIQAFTSIGKTFESRIEKNLEQKILKELKT